MDRRFAVPPGIEVLFKATLVGIYHGGYLVKLSPDKTPYCELEIECGEQLVAVVVEGKDAETLSEVAMGTPVEITGKLEMRTWIGLNSRLRERVVISPDSFVSLGPVLSEVKIEEYKVCRKNLM